MEYNVIKLIKHISKVGFQSKTAVFDTKTACST